MSNDYLNTLLVKNEEVLFTTHQHWLVLAGRLFTDVIAMVLLIFFSTMNWLPDWIDIIIYIVLLIYLGSIIYKISAWWNHQYVVTNRRVLQVQGILSKSTTDTALEKISDMNLRQTFFGRILDYGTIKILTAAEEGSDSFDNISRPIDFQTIVRETKEKMLNQASGQSGRNESDVAALIHQLSTLHQNGLLTEQEYVEKKAQLLDRI